MLGIVGRRVAALLAAGLLLALAACADTGAPPPGSPPAAEALAGAAAAPPLQLESRDRFPGVAPEPRRSVAEAPVSTFSIDVDTASYAVVRSFLADGLRPPPEAVRVEEMVNYFDYDYALPFDRRQPFAASVAVYPTPWNADTEILQIGIRSLDPYVGKRPAANLVWLVDVSGSMDGPDRLPLVRQALLRLSRALDAGDTVAIVTYSSDARVVLPPTPGHRRDLIERAVAILQPGGATAGSAGIKVAYALAEANFDPAAVNRVILATDGDFNVGLVDGQRLEDFIAARRAGGVYLTVLGFGRGNYQDSTAQILAQAGNGAAAYIDSVEEAEKVLIDEMASTLFPVADDVKIQVEFNPARIAAWRLIGYETRLLQRQDFDADAVDAGDIGAGMTVTALYEITPAAGYGLADQPLRYGGALLPPIGRDRELAFLRLRFKLPGEGASQLMEQAVTDANRVVLARAEEDYRFAAAVAAFAQKLRGEPVLRRYGYAEIAALARSALGPDPRGLRHGFLRLVEQAAYAAR